MLRYLTSAGLQAPSADNIQPFDFQCCTEELSIRFAEHRLSEVLFDCEHHATLLAVGAAIENIEQAAAALELPITADITQAVSAEKVYCTFSLPANAIGASVPQDAWQHPLFGRHTDRGAYKKTPVAAELASEVSSFNEGNATVQVIKPASDINATARLVRAASDIRFRTPEVHEGLGRMLRFSQAEIESNDGLDIHTLSVPPGGGLMLKATRNWKQMALANKLLAYKMFALVDSMPVGQAPLLIALKGDDGYRGAIDTGRLLERVWIFLNRHGLAVQPYFVISDQLKRLQDGLIPKGLEGAASRVRDRAEEHFGLDGQKHYMLLRVGYPKKEPVRSRRLPLETVMQDNR